MGEQAYAILYDAIRQKRIKPGERILEKEIAQRIGLSRTPVREALKRLEADGLIEHKSRFGTVVRSLSQREVVELYEMRIILEAAAAGMAARHASLAEIKALEETNQRFVEAEGDRAADLNAQFHGMIFHAARNRYLLSSFEELSNVLIVLGPTTLETATRIEQAFTEHQEIIHGLMTRDEVLSSRMARQHLEISLENRLRAIRE